jgi:tryptophan synthase alpha chain
MISISDAFLKCKNENRSALMPYLTAGFPNRMIFKSILTEFMKAGSDMIEIGIPFSDPLADGKTIQFSSQRALENGSNIENTFQIISECRNGFNTPLIIMSYLNPVHSYGISRFIKNAWKIGVQGLIIPDLIPEEGRDIEEECTDHDIDLIYLLAPTSDSKRRKVIAKRSRGFVYLVAVTGITGARKSLSDDLDDWILKVKKESSRPVCVGFGISTVKQARAVSKVADGVIVGSAIVEIIKNNSGHKNIVTETRRFIEQLRKGISYVKS